ncbi:fibrous sheath CABYR-binding protein-like [Macadamia integrifolia]|uniref:fibrous sheath CABYR-binding protein-like n=1 Tax=Macadamia integrifolia TaxID=60698 RepID=UPI001C4E9682|nr:fibrous sheath CABYR-binding protein-like [Macadamia integrifolia]
MYGRGNYAPQFRQGPPIPPPPFQQGPSAPLPLVIQQGSLAAPNHAVQPGPNPPVYRHGPPPPPPTIQQSGPPPPLVQQGQPIQVPNPGVVNAGQPFVHLPSSVHGNSQVIPPYSNVQQTSHYPSTVTSQNMHHISPALHLPAPPLSGPSHPEMMRAPVPPRILPPPPSQGQILYRTLHPSLAGGSQGHQHVGPLPPPPPSCFVPVTPAPFSSFVHAPVEDAYPPSMPPPPPRSPPSPPPIPSSPPPSPPKPSELSSNLALDAVSAMPHHSESGLVCDKPITSAEKLIDDVDRLLVPAQSREDVPVHVDFQNIKGRKAKMESLGEDGFSSEGEATLELHPSPPPPNLPAEVVRKIRVLCQFIAKVGPEFEDIARKKELGNPEYAFLFGGEPESEAAIAHDYFQWVKNKSLLGSKWQSNSSPKTREIKSSPKPCFLTDDGASSPANSDMDMEDDANQSDKDQEVTGSMEGRRGEPVSFCNEFLVVKEKLHVQQGLTEHHIDTLPGTTSCLYSGVAKQEEGSSLIVLSFCWF